MNKTYTLSSLPNYPKSAPSSDKISLTDGRFTQNKYFWQSLSTVGWQLKEQIFINLDLNKNQLIHKITFSTVRSIQSGIGFPQNIFVFTSKDSVNYKYIGDAADVLSNIPGGLQKKEFYLDNINDSARYVILCIIPNGNFIFCDEIEVFKTRVAGNFKSYPQVSGSIDQYVDSLKTPMLSKRKLNRLKVEVENSLIAKNSFQVREFKRIAHQLDQANTDRSFEIIKDNLGKLKGGNLNNKYNEPFILEYFNNWEEFNQSREPIQKENSLTYECLIPVGGEEFRSFLLTNSNLYTQTFNFELKSSKYLNLELYNVAIVPISYFESVADPLIRIDGNIDIEPGQSMMFILKMRGLKTGLEFFDLTISSKLKTSTINLKCQIYKINSSPVKYEGLNVNVWAYFNNPIVTNIEKKAAKDLQLHYVNTFVIPPTRLPDFYMNGEQAFVDYLNNFPTSEKILLYMDYSNPVRSNGYKGGHFMSPSWKLNFTNWYNKIKQLILNSNLSNAEIYLYPYDEIKEDKIKDFKRLILWAKDEIPGIKFYATLGTKVNIDSLLNIIDIAQIHDSYFKTGQLPAGNTEIWTYNGYTPARELSPYSFYRLMAWDAFLNGYKGIGFWNYADERNGNRLNLVNGSFYNRMGSYSVIYNDTSGNIISSRRWEAFSLGIEDYSVLQAYAQKFGDKKTKELTASVVNNPDNLELADSVKNSMIKEILGLKD